MSSNLPPLARAKYQEYLDAGALEERIKKLEEFLSLVPKHKATEKIVALNKSRLAKMKREFEDRKQKQKTTQKIISPFSIKKEGIQVILISNFQTPGVGKTSLLNYLTGAAEDKIGKFTALPEIGIYQYQKIRFQIVEMPSIMEGASDGVGNGKEILSQLRAADLLCFCIDLSRNIEEQMDLLVYELSRADIRINQSPPPLTIEKTGANKIQVLYLTKEAKDINRMEELTEEIKEVVYANGVRNGIIKIYGEITLDNIIDVLTPSVVYKKVIILGTKGDLSHTQEVFENLKKSYTDKFPIILGTSFQKENFPKEFGEIILKFLKKIRIYTMSGGIVAQQPLIMDLSVNLSVRVKDVAIKIHRSFYESFDHAIVIREGERQKRKKVGLDYILKDNDIVEIHIT
ncbi:MAG: 50S ribosome-binding GTPase [Candidatus Lokiarchaeota archaeon]|nr:50S ribosome-binding GTPase [Candidatus Lokiarchaeota archaeon]